MERRLHEPVSRSEFEATIARIEQTAETRAVDIKFDCPKCKDARMILIKDNRYGQCDCVKNSIKKRKEQQVAKSSSNKAKDNQTAMEDMEKFQLWLNNKKAKVINDWHQGELDLLHSLPESGVRGKKIVALYVERWRRLMEARMESLFEAYELYGRKLKKEDVEEFIHKVKRSKDSLLKTYSEPSFELSTVVPRMALEFDLVIQGIRGDLYIAMTRAALKKKKKKKKKLITPKMNVFNGPIHGAVQIEGEGNVQNVLVNSEKEKD